MPLLHSIRGGHFGADIDAWCEGTGIDRTDLVLANLSYELSQLANISTFGCTALAFNCAGGKGVAHVRNLDWPVDGCDRYSVIIDYKGACGPFMSIGWPGFIGVISGMAPGRFSITINQAPQVGLPSTDWPAAFALRNVFEDCETFDQAVRTLQDYQLSASTLILVAGTKRDQAVVIEHTGKKARCRWMEDGVLAVANHYEHPANRKLNSNDGDTDEDSEDRSEYALDRAADGAALPIGKMLSLMNRQPVLHEGTVQRMAFVPKTGEWKANWH